MKRKLLAGLLTMGLILGNGSAVFAAPVSMPDGAIFDADYYAQAYPDVAASVGNDINALYNHYVTFGQYEGRLPIAPVADPAKGSATRQASVLYNAVVGNNPYAGKKLTVPGSGLSVDALSYPSSALIPLGNGTSLQYNGNDALNGGYVTAAASGDAVTVCYDLFTSTDGINFNRLSPDAQYIFFIRNAVTLEIAGIFTNPTNGSFMFSANGGSRTFSVNDASQVWIIDSASGRLTPNCPLPNGSYFIAVGSTAVSSPTASNIFTVNR